MGEHSILLANTHLDGSQLEDDVPILSKTNACYGTDNTKTNRQNHYDLYYPAGVDIVGSRLPQALKFPNDIKNKRLLMAAKISTTQPIDLSWK